MTCHWPKGERIISNALGVAPEIIWPSRYEK
ncbi:helix-turn-helix domain-containing protein [Photorhabdus hindustanensis]